MTPEITSNKAIILFDGVCKLCVASVQFIIKYDTKSDFIFSQIQSDYSSKLDAKYHFTQHGIDITDPDSFVLISNDQIYIRSDAWLQICRKLRGWPRALIIFKFTPRVIRDFVYNLISKNRYGWFGKRETCMIPTKELEKRFR